jgi:hypothetical protein
MFEKIEAKILDNKFLLSDSSFLEKEVDRDLKISGLKNRDKETQK